MRRAWIYLIGLLLLGTGCPLTSRVSIAPEGECAIDRSLLGTWTLVRGDYPLTTAQVDAAGDNAYRITIGTSQTLQGDSLLALLASPAKALGHRWLMLRQPTEPPAWMHLAMERHGRRLTTKVLGGEHYLVSATNDRASLRAAFLANLGEGEAWDATLEWRKQ